MAEQHDADGQDTRLEALQQLVDQVPPLTTELDVLTQEVHAKRLTAQALQAELAAFDHQLEVLESSLAPLEGWTKQMSRMQRSLAEALDVSERGPAGDR